MKDYRTKKRQREMTILCFVLFFEYINYFVHTAFAVLRLPNALTTEAMLITQLLAVTYIAYTHRNRLAVALGLPVVICILYAFTLLIVFDGYRYISQNITEKLLLYCIPVYLCVFLIEDYSLLYPTLNKFCVFILLGEIVAIFLQTTGSAYFVQTDYQGISYGLMIPFVFFVCNPSRSTLGIAGAVVAFLLMLFFGGRGPIICAVFCVLYKLRLQSKRNNLWFVVLVAAGAMLVLGYNSIINWVITVSHNRGFGGSIVKYNSLGDVFSDSGRSNILKTALEIIDDRLFLGYGLGADRYYMGVYGFKYGNYPHNILLEFMIHFGAVVGSVLFLVLLYNIFRTVQRRVYSKELYTIFEICFMSTGFLILLFSVSYLISPLFYAMVAVMGKMKAPQKRSGIYEENWNSNLS